MLTRYERRALEAAAVLAGVMIVEMTLVIADNHAKKADSTADTAKAVYFTVEEQASPKSPNFAFTKENDNEQETKKESRLHESGADHEADGTAAGEELETLQAETEVESSGEALYEIAGQTIDESIQVTLHRVLSEAEIDYWFEGALCQIFQESQGDPMAENVNGLDKGLLQYRITYWTEPESIFDAEAQIRRYAREMAERFNAGLTIDEAISRHKTSDYCTEIDMQYVNQVKRWLGQMKKINSQEETR